MKGLLEASIGRIHLRGSTEDQGCKTASAYNSMDVGRVWWNYMAQTGRLLPTHIERPLEQDELAALLRGQHHGLSGFARDFGQEMTKVAVWNQYLSRLQESAKSATECPLVGALSRKITWPFLAVALCEHRQSLQRSIASRN